MKYIDTDLATIKVSSIDAILKTETGGPSLEFLLSSGKTVGLVFASPEARDDQFEEFTDILKGITG